MQYGTVGNPASIVTYGAQGATPEALQSAVMAALAKFDPSTQVVTSIELAGGGDGHTFVVLVEGANAADVVGGLTPSTAGIPVLSVVCYLGATAEDLLVARSAAAVPAPITNPAPPPSPLSYALIDEQLAGSSKGTRFMGMSVYFLAIEQPAGSNVPFAVALVTSSTALSAGATIVPFDSLAEAIGFSLPAVTTLQYNAPVSGKFLVDGNMTVSATSGGVVEVAVVRDPLGTPAAISGGDSKTTTTANGIQAVPFSGVAYLAPSGILSAQSKIGVQITMPVGGGHVTWGTLRVTPLA